MILKYDDNFIYIQTDNPSNKQVLEHYHNAVFSKSKGWRLPKNIWCMRELIKTFPELKDNEIFIKKAFTLKDAQNYLLHIRKNPAKIMESDNLRPYQLDDVSCLYELPQAGIFNEPRTGKTPTAITLLKRLGTRRNLIICPASLVYNWADEFAKWWPKAVVCIYAGSPQKRMRSLNQFDTVSNKNNAVLIISKDTIKKWKESPTFDTCIVDEAHFLRNYKTAQSKAVFSIKAKRRYALSGTPTVKHPSDIYGILHFLHPERFTSYWQFASRYFEIGTNYFSGGQEVKNPKPHREKELQEMIGLMSVQRKRKDVMNWLPEKQRITIPVEMSDKQKKLYNEMKQFFVAVDNPHEIDAQNVITQLMRMRQLCLDPRLLGFDVPGEKTKALIEYLDNNREPVIIMSMFTSYLKFLKPEIEKLGLKVGEINGEISSEVKQQTARDFQMGGFDVLLCNIISAGTGFTLDRATSIIFTDKAWNPSDNEQAEDRITPTTKERLHAHDIITFVCRDSVDKKINDLLEEKKSLTNIINEGGYLAIQRLLGG